MLKPSDKLQTILLRAVLACMALPLLFTVAPTAWSQAKDGTSDRKLVTRVEPEYPETLKRIYIGGLVRIEVVVDTTGKVETATLLGGNPVLGQSAMKAVKQWKYAPSAAKEKFMVQFAFDPHR